MAILKDKGKNILEHISPEELRRQNAEFLAQYPTDYAQIDYYTERAMRLWDEFEIDGSYELAGTRKNVEAWYESKRAQMELFRKHPYWCEEAKAIIFDSSERRNTDFIAAAVKLHSIRVYLYEKNRCTPTGDDILERIKETFEYLYDEKSEVQPTMTKRFVSVLRGKLSSTRLTKGISRMIAPGTKITRFVRKCCEEFQMSDGSIIDVTKFEDPHEDGDRNFDSFEKKYAQFADAISPTSTKNMTLMSLNFLDFMTMSNGNSWSSCHYINSRGLFHDGDGGSYHGAYKQGCLSYALDAPSFIFYTLPSNTDGNEYYRYKKLIRMCCQYENGVLITGKCYPANQKSAIELYRSMMHDIITDIEETENDWSCSDSTDDIVAFTKTADCSAHYADYAVSRQLPTISVCRSKHRFGFDSKMLIGHTAFCLHCGKEINSNARDWLQCSEHRVKMVCKTCGKKLVDGDGHVRLGERLYCADCVFYCAVHDRWEQIEYLHGTIPMRDGDKKVCASGMELLAQCVDCGVYHFKDKMMRTVNGYACKKHVRKYKKCCFCGKYVLNKEVHADDNGNFYCGECNDILSGLSDISVVNKDSYDVGDYVIVTENIENCAFGFSEEMAEYYPGRIVKITDKNFSEGHGETAYRFSRLDNSCWFNWAWSSNCIAGVVVGANDGFIGKKLSDIIR